ncbi:DUF1707 SHOCT-like domain-containing protein [Amycolatopsis saalfeldensis]|uniref:DUF1707 domain-containing protein n=1 Tax=Amycolatopsis saalfeldensis TaxID=394193 RepID=A0A1H8YMC0_9PSEU|nr:DUF1707 domain-containing protein [Amycolatopsis saalfeldensis]SEP53330.1 protein of unknown function [Amycolatopsis saalfeldensis]
MTDPGLRASDADRERVVSLLHAQVGEGRLTLEEFSERSAAAYAARTVGELVTLTRDLPVLVSPSPAPTPVSRWLVPLAVVLAVLFLAGALLALAGPATAGGMGQMMAQMGRICG